jgi:hypothetical protein
MEDGTDEQHNSAFQVDGTDPRMRMPPIGGCRPVLIAFAASFLSLTSCAPPDASNIKGKFVCHFHGVIVDLEILEGGTFRETIAVPNELPVIMMGTWSYDRVHSQINFVNFASVDEIRPSMTRSAIVGMAGDVSLPVEFNYFIIGRLRIGSDEGAYFLKQSSI